MAQAGDIVGQKYRLVRKLGEGGMGAVFEAVDEAFGGRVALKLIHPELQDTTDTISRFRREAEAAATAGHEAIVGVFDFGQTEDGSHFLVMEFLEGQSLNERLNVSGNLDVPLTAYIGCQTLSGLSAAHRVGVIHRDLKPDNIFLVDSGAEVPSIKILDFGTSLLVEPMGFTESSQRLTREGTIIGTPEYMSPEQARGMLDVDLRTDIYSLGLIMYECLTGRPPFVGRTPNEILFKVIMDQPEPPRSIRPDIPKDFEALIMWAISKPREGRPETSRVLFDALVPFVDDAVAHLLVWPVEEASNEAPTGFETYRVDIPEEVTDLESLGKYVEGQTESVAAARIDSAPGQLDMSVTIPMKVADVESALARRTRKTPPSAPSPVAQRKTPAPPSARVSSPAKASPASAPPAPAPPSARASSPAKAPPAPAPPSAPVSSPVVTPPAVPVVRPSAESPPSSSPPSVSASPAVASPFAAPRLEPPASAVSSPSGQPSSPFEREGRPERNSPTFILPSRAGKARRRPPASVIAFVVVAVVLFFASVSLGVWIAFSYVEGPHPSTQRQQSP